MTDTENSSDKLSNQPVVLEDRCLAPASSGTPMPKVKPPAPAKPKTTTNQSSNDSGDKQS